LLELGKVFFVMLDSEPECSSYNSNCAHRRKLVFQPASARDIPVAIGVNDLGRMEIMVKTGHRTD